MSTNVPVCAIDTDLISAVKKLTFRSSAEGEAIVMKVNTVAQTVVVDDTLEDISVDELREALPEHEPRWNVYDLLKIRRKHLKTRNHQIHRAWVLHFRNQWTIGMCYGNCSLQTFF